MAALNNSSDLNITPSRKRKRKFEKFEKDQTAATTCFTNAAFSSTPKKIFVKRCIRIKKDKENEPIFPNIGLEVKSVSEIARQHDVSNKIEQNPFEVLRKPPKKKHCRTEAIACFENPALNLELPEKLFNPYEVVRETAPFKSSINCFSNPALNLKVQDDSVLCNPFEVQREVSNRDLESTTKPYEISPEVNIRQGVSTAKPYKFKLGLPFVPRVDCRIDFNDLSLSQLTPSKLLSEKLVFSPVSKAKVTLGSVEEETTMDIGKELDLYQLELENSINEAKLCKAKIRQENVLLSSQFQMVGNEKRPKYTQKICGISEDHESEQMFDETAKQNKDRAETYVQQEQNLEVEKFIPETNPFRCNLNNQQQRSKSPQVVETENLNELYGCSSDERDISFDFRAPAPFVRAYTKPDAASTKLTISKESLKTDKPSESNNQVKKSLNVKHIIRKSIRKLMQTDHNDLKPQTETDGDSVGKPAPEKNNGFMNILRQSLRKKPVINIDEDPITRQNEISIIDGTERTLKLKSELLQTEYLKIEDLTNERKINLRNSIRKSTREVRNQFLKSVFYKKHEEYDFGK